MLTIAIQAGGESKRMGQDKALALFLGEPLILRVYRRVAHLGEEVLVTTNHAEAFAFLPAKVVPDLLPGTGALGGLYTALSAAAHPLVAVVACDMPFVSPALLAALRDRLDETDYNAIIPRSRGGLEPFHAVYRREACLPLIKTSLENGRLRADSWFADARIEYFSPEEVQRLDPHQLAFLNVNTPADLHRAEQQAQERSLL